MRRVKGDAVYCCHALYENNLRRGNQSHLCDELQSVYQVFCDSSLGRNVFISCHHRQVIYAKPACFSRDTRERRRDRGSQERPGSPKRAGDVNSRRFTEEPEIGKADIKTEVKEESSEGHVLPDSTDELIVKKEEAETGDHADDVVQGSSDAVADATDKKDNRTRPRSEEKRQR